MNIYVIFLDNYVRKSNNTSRDRIDYLSNNSNVSLYFILINGDLIKEKID